MFKSIQYKLTLFTILLTISVAGATYFFIKAEDFYGAACLFLAIYSLYCLNLHYKKFNKNILFLLNAMENGDYSFHFSEVRLSGREKELNMMLNRIKEILVKTRKEVIENENFLSMIIESVSTGIVILDKKNNIKSVNQAALQMLGLRIFTHLKQLSVVDKSFPELFGNLKQGDNTQVKIMNEREEIQISLRLSDIALERGDMKVITLSNIGNELEAKEMESWIRLIRVMTHEIMNSIAPITSLSETLLSSYKQSDHTEDNRDKNTIKALETINGTAKGLISFVETYRKFTAVPKPQCISFNLLTLIEDVIQLESFQIKEKGIDIQIEGRGTVLKVDADYSQIRQVLVNLIKNAIEAIEPDKQGEIKIVIYDEERVKIDICNNGSPIPEEIVPHIFIPFFTTKDSGSGIGLSVSRYIMRLHGGNLKYHASRSWTVFSMDF